MKSNRPKNKTIRKDVRLDWDWADGHGRPISDVMTHCAMHIINVETASKQDDLKRATDLQVNTDRGSVAVRIRRPEFLKYGDFTLRSWRQSGAKTELQKIRDGHGDWYLYAWSNGHGGFLDWIFVDLEILRQSGLLDNLHQTRNRDGRTSFINITREELYKHDCIVEHNTR